MDMDLSFWFLEYELDQMSRYLEIVQTAIQNYGREIEESYARDINKGRTADEMAFLEADYEDLFMEAGRDFPRFMLSSFIISWYSFVEQELLDLCEELRLNISVRPKENENFPKGIRRAYKFLYKAKNYEIDSNHWQELMNIGKLRNQIVHASNDIQCSYNQLEGNFVSYTFEDGDVYIALEKTLFDYLQKHKMLEINGPPNILIIPTLEYCQQLVEFGKELFYKLHKDLKPGVQISRHSNL